MNHITKRCSWLIVAVAMIGCKPKQGGPPPGAAIPVLVARAEQQRIESKIEVVGTLQANETVELQSEIDGVVDEVAFTEGTAVAADALLFKIDQEKLAASVAEAEANYKLAAANLKRNERLLKNRTISSQEYDRSLSEFRATKATLERTTRELDDATIRAPFDGITGARLVSPGQRVAKGQTLSSLVSLNPMKVELNIPERYLARLKKGLSVAIRVDAYPQTTFRGEVFFVSPQVDQATRTVLAKASIPNPEAKLRAGMFANVSAILAVRDDAVVIPESAVMMQKDNTSLYVVNDEKKVAIRPVSIGQRLRGRVEVTDGLTAGELVVAEGLQKLRPGANVSFSEPGADAESAANS